MYIADAVKQLDEATKSLDAKGVIVIDLEAQIENLKTSLTAASVEVELKAADLKKLVESKATVDLILDETQMSLRKVQTELDEVTSSLKAVQKEVKHFLIIPLVCLFGFSIF